MGFWYRCRVFFSVPTNSRKEKLPFMEYLKNAIHIKFLLHVQKSIYTIFIHCKVLGSIRRNFNSNHIFCIIYYMGGDISADMSVNTIFSPKVLGRYQKRDAICGRGISQKKDYWVCIYIFIYYFVFDCIIFNVFFYPLSVFFWDILFRYNININIILKCNGVNVQRL